jgi:hypothetical protein
MRTAASLSVEAAQKSPDGVRFYTVNRGHIVVRPARPDGSKALTENMVNGLAPETLRQSPKPRAVLAGLRLALLELAGVEKARPRAASLMPTVQEIRAAGPTSLLECKSAERAPQAQPAPGVRER